MVPPAAVVAATRSASDSILRCGKGEWFRLQNGLAAKVILDFRLRLENRCKLFPVYALQRASILDFKPKLENRCKDFLVSGLLRALILKFKPRLENRCKDFPIYTLLRAVILDLMGSIWESLQGFPTELVVSTVSASDSNFRCGKEEWFRLQRQSRRRSSASDSNLRCRRQEKS